MAYFEKEDDICSRKPMEGLEVQFQSRRIELSRSPAQD